MKNVRYARFAACRIGLFATLLSMVCTAHAVAAASLGFVQTPGQMSVGRDEGTVVLLPSGKVLIAGGMGGLGIVPTIFDSAEVYDPQTGQFAFSSGHMSTVRILATGTLLPNGKVLITGGLSSTSALASADIYDPSTDTFAPTANTMSSARADHTATLLADGTVLIAGGIDASSQPLATAELYDPATNRFTLLPNTMTDSRIQAAAALLQTGQVLIVGEAITIRRRRIFTTPRPRAFPQQPIQ